MRKFIAPIIVFATGFGISYWAYIIIRGMETERAVAEFDRRAANISSVLTNGITGYSIAMETLKNLTSVSLQMAGELTIDRPEELVKLREEWVGTKAFFNQMAKDAGNSLPGLRGLGWAVSSPYSQLGLLQLGGKYLISPEYEIREVSADGGFVRVTERDEHFPIFYIEPMELNRIALGIDLAAAGVTRRAIIEARDTGKTVSTPPIGWIKLQTGQLGFLVFDAVYKNDEPMATVEERRANLYSISFGLILIDDMLNSSLRGLREEGLEFFVFARSDEIETGVPQSVPVFSSNGKPESLEVFRKAAAITGFGRKTIIDVMGRDWSLYCYPRPGFLARHRSTGPITAFASGILITLAFTLYLLRSSGRTQRIEALVENRTQELSRSHENLEREMAGRKEADRHRQELESQLMQTQKMESVGQLAGGIAHDFNNILVAIMGYADLIERHSGSQKDVETYIGQVKSAADRAAKLTSQVLAFSKRQIIKPEPLDLNDLISGLVDMLRRLIPENIDYVFAPGVMEKSVLGDSGQIEQILVNLVVNACGAMPEGGTVTIRTREVTFSDQDVSNQSWAKPGAFVRLQISDTGHGIPRDMLERIFEPFYTTKSEGEGTGLGLSVVFGIVSQHSGFLHVDSKPDSGSIFSVYLPSIDQAPVRIEQEPLGEAKGGTETILVVEDDEQVRDIAVHILEGAGYQILKAADGEIAVRAFDEHKSCIDLVLLDVVMPKLGGRGVLNHIRETGSSVPVVFTSGYSGDGIHTKFILDEGLDLIAKPYSSESLLRHLRTRLDRHPDHEP